MVDCFGEWEGGQGLWWGSGLRHVADLLYSGFVAKRVESSWDDSPRYGLESVKSRSDHLRSSWIVGNI